METGSIVKLVPEAHAKIYGSFKYNKFIVQDVDDWCAVCAIVGVKGIGKRPLNYPMTPENTLAYASLYKIPIDWLEEVGAILQPII